MLQEGSGLHLKVHQPSGERSSCRISLTLHLYFSDPWIFGIQIRLFAFNKYLNVDYFWVIPKTKQNSTSNWYTEVRLGLILFYFRLDSCRLSVTDMTSDSSEWHWYCIWTKILFSPCSWHICSISSEWLRRYMWSTQRKWIIWHPFPPKC